MSLPSVLFIHNFYREHGGEDEHVEQLERLLKKKGHRVISYFKKSSSITGSSLIQKLRVPIDAFYSREINQEIGDIICNTKPDLIHIHNIFPLIPLSVYKIISNHQIPIVQSIYNYRFMCLNGLFMLNNGEICERCRKGNFAHGVIRRCYQGSFIKSFWLGCFLWWQKNVEHIDGHVDSFICPTEFVKEKLELGSGPNKCSVVPYFIQSKDESASGMEASSPYAIYIGRISPEKGIRTMLRAFEKLPQVPLKIVGKGPLENDVKEFISKKHLTHIEFLGFVDCQTRDNLLKRATCLVFPSECYETLGLTILESFRVGVPVVASRLGGREAFIKDGINGKIFEPGHPGSLGRAVVDIFNESKQWRGRSAEIINLFHENYSEIIVYQGLMNCYSSALQRSKSPSSDV